MWIRILRNLIFKGLNQQVIQGSILIGHHDFKGYLSRLQILELLLID